MYEDTAEKLVRLGNMHKLNNQWQLAGDTFLHASEAWNQSGDNKIDMINNLIEAGNCYKKISPCDAVKTFLRTIDHYNIDGKFGRSAKVYKEIAEIFELDHNKTLAIEAYENSAQMFERDNRKSDANSCMLKVALFVAERDELIKAGKIFENIANYTITTRFGALTTKGYLLQGLLCYLALGDQIKVRNKIEEYKNIDYSFASSRECDFVTKLIDAMESYDVDKFSQVCEEFDRVTPLDSWKISMLVKAKNILVAIVGDNEPDLS
jgi:alpha-soluble NSF attachment protein